MIANNVDLPQPDGPTRTVNSPSSMSRLTFLSTSTGPNRLEMPRTVNPAIPNSLPHRASGQAAHEIFSAKQVDDQRWQRCQQHRGTLDDILRRGRPRVSDRVEGGGDRLIGAGQEGDGIQELVPDTGKLPDRANDQDGRRQRQDDAPEDAVEPGTVDPSGLDQILGNGEEVVAPE